MNNVESFVLPIIYLLIYLLHFNFVLMPGKVYFHLQRRKYVLSPPPSSPPPTLNLTNLTLTVILNLTKPDLDISKRSIEFLQSRILRIYLRIQFDCQDGSQNMGEIQ